MFQNAALLFAGNLSGAGVGFLQSVAVTKALGPSQFGIWGIVVSFCALIQMLLSFRTEEPLTRFLVAFKTAGDDASLKLLLAVATLANALTGLLSFAVIALGAFVLTRYAHLQGALPLYLIYGTTVLFNFPNAAWYCVARDLGRFRSIAFIPNALSVVQLGVTLLLWALHGLTLVSFAWLTLALAAANGALTTVLLNRLLVEAYATPLRALPWRRALSDWRSLEGFWSFMSANYLAGSVSALVKSSDMLILGYFAPSAEVGCYRLAKSLASVIQTVARSMSAVVYQQFNEAIQARSGGALGQTLWRLNRLWLPLVTLGVLVAIGVSPVVFPLVYGQAFAAAVAPFQILSVGIGVSIGLFWSPSLVLALGRQDLYLYAQIVNAVLFAIASVLLVPPLGAVGTAISLSGAWAFGHLLSVAIAWREYARTPGNEPVARTT